MCTCNSNPPKASNGEAMARKIVPSPAAKESSRQTGNRKGIRNWSAIQPRRYKMSERKIATVGPIGIAHELITALAGSSIDWYYSSQPCIAHKSLQVRPRQFSTGSMRCYPPFWACFGGSLEETRLVFSGFAGFKAGIVSGGRRETR